jgi:hypothetical protein
MPDTNMIVRSMTPRLRAVVAAVLSAAAAAWLSGATINTQPISPAIDRDDIGGIVTSDQGAEGGVWVIAETDELPTRLTRIVVTDDQGRFVVPDLPRAGYQLFVRGYGLLDSKRVAARPGERVALTTVAAPSEREAAAVYPASYWLTVMRVPPTGPIHPADLTRTMKQCMGCHQLGSRPTRELPAALGSATTQLDAWDIRMQRGHQPGSIYEAFARLRGQRTMFSEWTGRIAERAYPLSEPPRPRGVERNLVVTLWDWGGANAVTAGAAASYVHNPRINANGPVYGPSPSEEAMIAIDPATHTARAIELPMMGADPSDAVIDGRGRVWLSATHRPANQQPAFCADSANRYAANLRLHESGKQLAVYDPRIRQIRPVDTCVTVLDTDIGSDGRLYMGGAGVIGWIDAAAPDAGGAAREQDTHGWCPVVVEKDGERTAFPCRRVAAGPDGAVWCASGDVTDDRLLRLQIGADAPHSCTAEMFQPPPWRDVAGLRSVAVDDSGVAWVNLAATDHLASFDRRRCHGPADASGLHCPEGWTFYAIPGAPFSIASPTAGGDVVLRGALAARTTDLMHHVVIDRSDVLGLNGGRRVPMTLLSNGDAALALLPETGEFVTLRVPYPLGFYGRSLEPRVDDQLRGWKGRGLWSNYASSAPGHVEGGPGVRGKAVKFQLRPDPLAR